MEDQVLKLACVQMEVRVGDTDWNLAHSIELIQEAAGHGADLACFPESVLDGYALYHHDLPSLARLAPGPETELIASAARQAGIWALWTLAEKVGENVCNTALLFDRQGQIRLHYRKSHLCTEVNEHLVYQPGKDLLTTDLALGFRIGAMICFDRHFPEVSRTLRLQGANLILHPTATDWCISDLDHINHAMMRTRAYENRCYILSVNQVNFGGSSALYGPWGEVLNVAGKGEEIFYAEISLERIANQPENTFELLKYRRPEMYRGWAKG